MGWGGVGLCAGLGIKKLIQLRSVTSNPLTLGVAVVAYNTQAYNSLRVGLITDRQNIILQITIYT